MEKYEIAMQVGEPLFDFVRQMRACGSLRQRDLPLADHPGYGAPAFTPSSCWQPLMDLSIRRARPNFTGKLLKKYPKISLITFSLAFALAAVLRPAPQPVQTDTAGTASPLAPTQMVTPANTPGKPHAGECCSRKHRDIANLDPGDPTTTGNTGPCHPNPA